MARTFLFVPDILVEEQDSGWLLHSSLLMTKENQLPLGLTRTCELFSLREDTSC